MDVFISYSKKDRDLCRRMVKLVKDQGYTVWWDDRLDPTETFDAIIERELDAAHAVLVLWTANSVQSVWVKEEATRGNKARKLVQARFDDCTVPMGFNFFQYGNMESRRPGLSSGWKKIKEWLEALVAQGRAGATAAGGGPDTSSTADPIAAELRELKAMMAQLLASKEAGAATNDAVTLAEAAAQSLVESPEPADIRAKTLIEEGRIEEALAALKQDAASADDEWTSADEAAKRAREAAAEKWRRLGALASLVNVALAIEAYEAAARLEPSDCWTQIYLCRLHLSAGSLMKARAAAEAAIRAADNDRDRACGQDMLGDVAVAEGDLPAARKAYEDGLLIRKDLSARDPGNMDWRRDLSISYERLGDVTRAEGDLPAARKAYEDSLAIAKDLTARDPGNTDWRRDLSVSYDRVGDVARAEGDLPAARKAYEEGLAIRKDLSDRDPGNTNWRRDLSISYDRLGDVARGEGDLPAARKAYEDSLAIAKDLSARDAGNAQWRRDLSVSYDRVGDVARAEGDLTAARKAYEDSLAIDEDLSARDPGNAQWRRDLSVSYNKLGDVARAEGDLPAARKAYEDSLAIRKDLSARDPGNAEWRRDVWSTMWRIAYLPAGDITWAAVRDLIQAEKDRGALRKDDEKFLAEAKRRAAPTSQTSGT